MKKKTWYFVSVITLAAVVFGLSIHSYAQKRASEWKVHDRNRPAPKVVTPGETPSDPPSDAIVLFDGKNLSQWIQGKDRPPRWKVENGYMEVVPKTGSIFTKQSFGDCQLHIEWASPAAATGSDQGRGNSGIKFMGQYEVQVLDTYKKTNETYTDGQAGAVYGQYPPLVNVCKAPGQWQTYDIVFRRPILGAGGNVIRPAYITVFHNGVLIQDHEEILGNTSGKARGYKKHGDKEPLMFQDHSHPVRYRNIWIRELPEPRVP
jgi:3-keto-disaccharide hydrolase